MAVGGSLWVFIIWKSVDKFSGSAGVQLAGTEGLIASTPPYHTGTDQRSRGVLEVLHVREGPLQITVCYAQTLSAAAANLNSFRRKLTFLHDPYIAVLSNQKSCLCCWSVLRSVTLCMLSLLPRPVMWTYVCVTFQYTPTLVCTVRKHLQPADWTRPVQSRGQCKGRSAVDGFFLSAIAI